MATDLVKYLRKADINVDRYERGPMGKDVFTVAVRPITKEGTVKIWEGLAQIEPHISKRHRQAVLNIVEPARKIEREVQYYHSGLANSVTGRERAIRKFEEFVILPDTVQYTVDNYREIDDFWKKAHVTASIPRSNETLLMGMDETYHFIAALRKKVDSVKEAHEILRPRGTNKDSIRQGEWFFTPVDEKLNAALDERITVNWRKQGWVPLESGSSHNTNFVVNYNGARYAIGFVADARKTHHAPVFLRDWHRVSRNREVAVRNDASSIRRSWD